MPPKIDTSELDFKRKCRKAWEPNWSEAYEPGTGSGRGYPDLQFLDPTDLQLFPIELKVVNKQDQARIWPRDVQPAQNVWHYNFRQAGGRSVILIGDKSSGSWVGYAFWGHWAEFHKEGYLKNQAIMVFPEEKQHNFDGMLRFFKQSTPCFPRVIG